MNKSNLIILEPKFFTINKLHKENDKFIINREYQRSEAWDKQKRQRLIESIFKNWSIGILFIKEHTDGSYEILDGQQRIETIRKFLNNELSTSLNTDGFKDKKFEELEKYPDESSKFLGFKIWFIPVQSDLDEELADLFLRLQEGQPLNTPEKLNAIQTLIKKFVIEVSCHNTFKKCKIDKYRFSHRHLAAQCVYFYKNSNLGKKEFPNPPRYEDLVYMYRNVNVSKTLHKDIFGVLDYIYQALDEDIKVINKKSDITVLFVFAYYVKNNYVIHYEIFRNFITDFFTKVENSKLKEGKPKNDYEEYKFLRKAGATKENFKRKFEILLKNFEAFEEHVRKDKNRFPNLGQRLTVYYRDKKICQYCKKPVKSIEEASFDHIKPHAIGGPTDIKNLCLLHKGKCHEKFEKLKIKSK